jgi:hypothetical protein
MDQASDSKLFSARDKEGHFDATVLVDPYPKYRTVPVLIKTNMRLPPSLYRPKLEGS